MADHEPRAQEALTSQSSEERPALTTPDTSLTLVPPVPCTTVREGVLVADSGPCGLGRVYNTLRDLWLWGLRGLGPASVPAPSSYQLPPGFSHLELSLTLSSFPGADTVTFPFPPEASSPALNPETHPLAWCLVRTQEGALVGVGLICGFVEGIRLFPPAQLQPGTLLNAASSPSEASPLRKASPDTPPALSGTLTAGDQG